MRKFYKNIYKIPLLLLALGVLSGGEFFHHHESLQSESHCQACLFSHTLSAGDVNTEPVIQNLLSFRYLLPPQETQEADSHFSDPCSSRAPPFSS